MSLCGGRAKHLAPRPAVYLRPGGWVGGYMKSLTLLPLLCVFFVVFPPSSALKRRVSVSLFSAAFHYSSLLAFRRQRDVYFYFIYFFALLKIAAIKRRESVQREEKETSNASGEASGGFFYFFISFLFIIFLNVNCLSSVGGGLVVRLVSNIWLCHSLPPTLHTHTPQHPTAVTAGY